MQCLNEFNEGVEVNPPSRKEGKNMNEYLDRVHALRSEMNQALNEVIEQSVNLQANDKSRGTMNTLEIRLIESRHQLDEIVRMINLYMFDKCYRPKGKRRSTVTAKEINDRFSPF